VAQAFFTYGEGPRWKSHASWDRGGGGYAPWRLLSLFNHVGPGDMLTVRLENAPTADLPETRQRKALDDVPMVAIYATRAGDRLTVAILSRRLPNHPDPADDGFTPLSLSMPIISAERLTLYRMAGPYNAHDVDGQEVALDEISLPVPDLSGEVAVDAALGADARGLPPASALVYVFEGVREVR
jgi:hypothetical protein